MRFSERGRRKKCRHSYRRTYKSNIRLEYLTSLQKKIALGKSKIFTDGETLIEPSPNTVGTSGTVSVDKVDRSDLNFHNNANRVT